MTRLRAPSLALARQNPRAYVARLALLTPAQAAEYLGGLDGPGRLQDLDARLTVAVERGRPEYFEVQLGVPDDGRIRVGICGIAFGADFSSLSADALREVEEWVDAQRRKLRLSATRFAVSGEQPGFSAAAAHARLEQVRARFPSTRVVALHVKGFAPAFDRGLAPIGDFVQLSVELGSEAASVFAPLATATFARLDEVRAWASQLARLHGATVGDREAP